LGISSSFGSAISTKHGRVTISSICVLNPIAGSGRIMGTVPVTVSPQLSPHAANNLGGLSTIYDSFRPTDFREWIPIKMQTQYTWGTHLCIISYTSESDLMTEYEELDIIRSA